MCNSCPFLHGQIRPFQRVVKQIDQSNCAYFCSDRKFSTQIVEPKTCIQIFMETVDTRNHKLHNGVKSVRNSKFAAVSYFFTLFVSVIRGVNVTFFLFNWDLSLLNEIPRYEC